MLVLGGVRCFGENVTWIALLSSHNTKLAKVKHFCTQNRTKSGSITKRQLKSAWFVGFEDQSWICQVHRILLGWIVVIVSLASIAHPIYTFIVFIECILSVCVARNSNEFQCRSEGTLKFGHQMTRFPIEEKFIYRRSTQHSHECMSYLKLVQKYREKK